MELEISWGRAVKIWWAYTWRNIIAILVSMIAGGSIGFAVGFICGMVGISTNTIKIVTGIIGAIIGLAFSIVPMKMILGKDYGEFRLVLLSHDNNHEQQCEPSPDLGQ